MEKMIDHYDCKIDLTLLGCGFLGSYHVGAVSLLEQIWPNRPYNRICGASSGGLLAVLAASGVQLEDILRYALNLLCVLRSFLSEPRKFIPICDLVAVIFDKLLPWNAHELCGDRLGISVTGLWPLKNTLVSEFNSRSDLIEAACAGCFLPVWSGSLVGPKFRGKFHLDGGITNNVPKFDPEPGVTQVTVSPFAGYIDVSPKDKQNLAEMNVLGTRYIANWNNVIRSARALFPMRLSTYRQYLIEGHSDMKRYILDNDFIKCQSCYIVREHSTSCDSIDQTATGTACLKCLQLLERVDSLKVSENLLRHFEAESQQICDELVRQNKSISADY